MIKPRNLRLRYAVSFILVLALPMMLFGAYILSFFDRQFKNEIISNNINALVRLQSVMDAQIRQLNAIIIQMNGNEALRPFYFQNDPTRGITAMNALQNYKLSNVLIDDIFLIYKDDNFFYSNSSSYTADSFASLYHFTNLDATAYAEDLRQLQTQKTWLAEEVLISGRGTADYLVFEYPLWFSGNAGKYGSVVILVNTVKIDAFVQNKALDQQPVTLFLDPDKQLVYQSDGKAAFDLGETKQMIAGMASSTAEAFQNQNNRYYLTYVASPDTGWGYISIIPFENMLARLSAARTIALLLLVITMLLGLVFILFLVNYNYNPIKQLQNYISQNISLSMESLNELDLIRESFAQLLSAKHDLEHEIIANRSVMREYLVYRILNGELTVCPDQGAEFANAGIELVNPCCRALVMMDVSGNCYHREQHEQILQALNHLLAPGLQLLGMSGMEKGQLIMLLLSAGPEELEPGSLYVQMLQAMHRDFGDQLYLSVGNIYRTLEEAGRSYMEAGTAMEYHQISGSHTVLYFSAIFNQSSRPDAYQAFQEKLRLEILNAVPEAIRKQLTAIQQGMIRDQLPLFAARLFWYDFINKLFLEIREIGCSEVRLGGLDLHKIIKARHIDDLQVTVEELLQQFVTVIRQQKDQGDSTRGKYLQYLQEHGLDQAFSVQLMAEHFELSISSLNQHFKAASEMTIWDYVMKLRMDRAKQLLVDTQLSLQEILSLIGYTDASNFIRKFKQETGKTPREYRMIHRGFD